MRRSSRIGAGRGAGWPFEAQAIRTVVLVDCVDCRSRRAAPGQSPDGDGSSLSLGHTRWKGERASEAGSRRQSRETVAGSPRSLREQVEGALVDGRRSGLWKRPSLTRRWWKRVWRPAKVGAAKAGPEVAGCDRGVRGYVASSDRGRKHRGRGIPPEGPSIAAPARTERYLVRAMQGVKSRASRRDTYGRREPKLEGRRQAMLHPGEARGSGRGWAHEAGRKACGGEAGNRTVRRVLVSSVDCRHR